MSDGERTGKRAAIVAAACTAIHSGRQSRFLARVAANTFDQRRQLADHHIRLQIGHS